MDPIEPSTPPQAPVPPHDTGPRHDSDATASAPAPLPAAARKRFSWRDFILGLVSGFVGSFVVLAFMIFGLAYYVARSQVSPNFATAQSVGAIPEFPATESLSVYGKADEGWTFTTLDGKPATLADFRGKVVFLNFWATWCGPCVAEMPSIERLREALKDDPVEFVLVSDEDRDKIDKFIERKGWSLTSYRTDADTPAVFESPGIPATYIVNREGLVVFKHIGMAQWDHDSVVSFVKNLTK